MKRSINHQFFFSHPPEAVWEYLTNPDLMELWLMKTNFQPIVGADFQFRTGPIPKLDFDGIFYCRVLEFVPFKRLSYSWNSGTGEGKITLDSIVVWRLQPTDKGTEVFLEHSGFEKEENLDMFNGLNHGWIEKFQNIEKLFNAKQHDTAKA
jgi:uncharacterized protein YndB with AHSA1/START domain